MSNIFLVYILSTKHNHLIPWIEVPPDILLFSKGTASGLQNPSNMNIFQVYPEFWYIVNIIAVCSMFVLIKCTYDIYRLLRFSWGLNHHIGRLEVTEAQRPIPRRTCALRCASSTGNGKWMHMVKIPLEQSPFPVKAWLQFQLQGIQNHINLKLSVFYNDGVNNEITFSCFKQKKFTCQWSQSNNDIWESASNLQCQDLVSSFNNKNRQLTITSSPPYM